MAFVEEHLAAFRRAIGRGECTVHLPDRAVTFESFDQLCEAESLLARAYHARLSREAQAAQAAQVPWLDRLTPATTFSVFFAGFALALGAIAAYCMAVGELVSAASALSLAISCACCSAMAWFDR
jgi:hypothetical protein